MEIRRDLEPYIPDEPPPEPPPTEASTPVARVAPTPPRTGPAGTVSPLLDRFLARSREDLLAIPGMTPAKAAALGAARDAGKIDHWGDVEALPGFDAATMHEVYRSEAVAHVKAQGLGRGSTVLFLASMPRNASQLDLEGERDKVDDKLDVVEVRDPTIGEIEALAATGAFRAVWVAGHGIPGKLIMSDADAQVEKVSAEDFARAVSASPEVRFVMTSVCHGADGERGATRKLNDVIAAHGPSAAGYANTVSDRKAIAMSAAMARALAGGVSFWAAVSAAYMAVYPKDDGYGGEPRGGGEGRGSFAPRDVRPASAVRPPRPASEWQPFVQWRVGANDTASPDHYSKGWPAPPAPAPAPQPPQQPAPPPP